MLANMPRIVIVMAKEWQIKSSNAIEGKKMKDNLTNSEEARMEKKTNGKKIIIEKN